MTDQEKTISKIEKAMREKVEQQLPVFEKMPVAQTMTNTQGEKVLKNNPAMQEIRSLFRDYVAVVRVQRELAGEDSDAAEVTSLDALRKKFKVV